jgi:peptidoglycan/LPS O-acetylase OafA/YrhL
VTSHRHLPGLDAIRGLAVAAVVAYHLGAIPGGWVGVDVFFVLSGFLVTAGVLRAVEAPDRSGWVRKFWGRRARRLAPALALMVMVVTSLAVAGAWPQDRLDELAGDGFAALTWWANWRHLAAGDGGYWASGPSPLLHTWSLSIEEQFYVAWPLVVAATAWVARRAGWPLRRAIGVAAGAGALASGVWGWMLALRLDDAELSRIYLGTDTRISAPLVGCALACAFAGRTLGVVRRRWATIAGVAGTTVLAAVALTVHVSDPSWYRSAGRSVVAVAAAPVVVWASTWRTSLHPTLGWMGTRSYGLYLWSWPAQVFVEEARPAASPWLVAAIVLPATAIVTEVSYRLVEQPVLLRTGWVARPLVRRPVFAAAGVLVAAALVTAALLAVAPPVHERLEAGTANMEPPPTPTTVVDAEPEAPAEVDRGPWTVMVTGDSAAFTAGRYAPATGTLEHVASVDGRGTIGCGVLARRGYSYRSVDGAKWRLYETCANQPEAEAVGLSGRPDVVVTMAGAWEWADALAPDGHVVEARSDEMAGLLADELLSRAEEADRAGAAYRIVPFLCPRGGAADVRSSPAHLDFMAGVFDRVVDAGATRGFDVAVLDIADVMCTGGDPHGEPTDARKMAMPDGVHVDDETGGAWLWSAVLDEVIGLSMTMTEAS